MRDTRRVQIINTLELMIDSLKQAKSKNGEASLKITDDVIKIWDTILDFIKTEKREIIKPYLEKLNESIMNHKWHDVNDDFMAGVAAVSNMIYDIIEMIGKE